MSLSNSFENSLALLIYNNTPITNFGDAAGILGSLVAGSYYWALHTADPGEAGSAVTSETAYTGYARIAAARSGAGLTVAGSVVSPTANVVFGKCTASPGGAITHFSLVNTASGAGVILNRFAATPNVTMAVGVSPIIETTSTITFD